MKLEWGLTAGNAEGEVDRLLAVSRKAEGGLPLTEAQARAVAQAHGEALRRTGRIEFGKSAAEKLVEIFAGSPWLTREEQGQQLAELAALFYDCRAELPDSLPDGWGRLLVDRLLMKNKINPYEVDSINRLAIVGKSGMGALEYYP